jgi:hypothetical protein
MKQVQISYSGADLDYEVASRLAFSLAASDHDLGDPVVMAWHDRPGARMSPAIAGADVNTRWHDSGESHEGRLEVDVNGEFDFIFADAKGFDSYGPSPYVNLVDRDGTEYICQLSALHDPHRPEPAACIRVDEYFSKQT